MYTCDIEFRKPNGIHVPNAQPSNLVYHVRFQLERAPPRAFNDGDIYVHALTHGVVVLAPSNLQKYRGVVYILGAKVVRIVPVFLELRGRSGRRPRSKAVTNSLGCRTCELRLCHPLQ